jgi:hypothetical protein
MADTGITAMPDAEAETATLASDVEKKGLSALEAREEALLRREGDHGIKRDLKPRVVSMIAIAGTIGTGLFLSSGSALTVSNRGGGLTIVGRARRRVPRVHGHGAHGRQHDVLPGRDVSCPGSGSPPR